METLNVGAELNFNTVSIQHGALSLNTDISYDSVLETTFHVCKIDCQKNTLEELSIDEQRDISCWLNRKIPRTLRIISDDPTYDYLFFEGTFNLNKVEINGKFIGYELHFVSNRPFALGTPIRVTINATTPNYTYRLYNESDEVGHIYPKRLYIECLADADSLTITNSLENRITEIKNCSKGEIIIIDDLFNISSQMPDDMELHKIQNDFNYIYFRIGSSYKNRLNILTISHPCKIIFDYAPIIKGVGL